MRPNICLFLGGVVGFASGYNLGFYATFVVIPCAVLLAIVGGTGKEK